MLCRTQFTHLLIRKFVVYNTQSTYLSIRKFVVLSMQLVYLLTLKPVPKNSQTSFYASSNTTGYLANYPPSPFGEGRGEAAFYL